MSRQRSITSLLYGSSKGGAPTSARDVGNAVDQSLQKIYKGQLHLEDMGTSGNDDNDKIVYDYCKRFISFMEKNEIVINKTQTTGYLNKKISTRVDFIGKQAGKLVSIELKTTLRSKLDYDQVMNRTSNVLLVPEYPAVDSIYNKYCAQAALGKLAVNKNSKTNLAQVSKLVIITKDSIDMYDPPEYMSDPRFYETLLTNKNPPVKLFEQSDRYGEKGVVNDFIKRNISNPDLSTASGYLFHAEDADKKELRLILVTDDHSRYKEFLHARNKSKYIRQRVPPKKIRIRSISFVFKNERGKLQIRGRKFNQCIIPKGVE